MSKALDKIKKLGDKLTYNEMKELEVIIAEKKEEIKPEEVVEETKKEADATEEKGEENDKNLERNDANAEEAKKEVKPITNKMVEETLKKQLAEKEEEIKRLKDGKGAVDTSKQTSTTPSQKDNSSDNAADFRLR